MSEEPNLELCVWKIAINLAFEGHALPFDPEASLEDCEKCTGYKVGERCYNPLVNDDLLNILYLKR